MAVPLQCVATTLHWWRVQNQWMGGTGYNFDSSRFLLEVMKGLEEPKIITSNQSNQVSMTVSKKAQYDGFQFYLTHNMINKAHLPYTLKSIHTPYRKKILV